MPTEQLFASFLLDRRQDLEIALPAEQVSEATPLSGQLQQLPGGVAFLQGIMTLRHNRIPVVNLKKRLGLAETDYAAGAKVAVVQIAGQQIGLLFDDIKEVFRVPADEVVPVAAMLQSEERLIKALIRRNDGQRSAELLDLQKVFSVLQKETGKPPEPVVQKKVRYLRYVIFRCGNQEYGVPVENAQEITFLTDIDHVFQSGALEGALQLRGQTVPVMNAGYFLQSASCGEDVALDCQRVLVLSNGECTFGMIVEEVREILSVPEDAILSLPVAGELSCRGIFARPGGSNIMLLDIQRLVALEMEEMRAMAKIGKCGEESRARQQAGSGSSQHQHLITEHCYLIFSISRHFAIELKDVQEIIENSGLMRLPGENDYRAGVINLRGRIVPVVNLRAFYGYPAVSGGNEASKLIICRRDDFVVALEVDVIITIYKQEKFHATPSLNPQFAGKKDTLDRLIEFTGGDTVVEHVLVVNMEAIARNYLHLDQLPAAARHAAADQNA